MPPAAAWTLPCAGKEGSARSATMAKSAYVGPARSPACRRCTPRSLSRGCKRQEPAVRARARFCSVAYTAVSIGLPLSTRSGSRAAATASGVYATAGADALSVYLGPTMARTHYFREGAESGVESAEICFRERGARSACDETSGRRASGRVRNCARVVCGGAGRCAIGRSVASHVCVEGPSSPRATGGLSARVLRSGPTGMCM
jgi:hypothetical protein